MAKELKHYWCVKVVESISPDGEIYLYSDSVDVFQGDLIFRSDEGLPVLAIAKGNWLIFFAASTFDGHARFVEHWKGEIIRKEKNGQWTP